MRAVVVYEPGGPEALVVEEVDPPRPGPNEALIQVVGAGVDYHDVIIRQGTRRLGVHSSDLTVHRGKRKEKKSGLILGHEVSGIVVEVGELVTRVAPGDRVAAKQLASCGWCKLCRSGNETRCDLAKGTEGGYAEYVAIAEDALVKVPEDIDLKSAAIFACAIGTALHAIKPIGRVQIGDNVLVTGPSGGVGIHAVQLCAAAGARVIAVTSSPEKVDVLKEYGADEVIASPDLNFHDAVKDLTDGLGVDVVVDCVGSRTFPSGFRSIAKRGRYLLVGQLFREDISINPALVFRKAVEIHGPGSTTRQELAEVITLVQRGKVKPVFSGEFALEEAGHVHQMLEDRKIVGRSLLVPAAAGGKKGKAA